MKAIFGLGNPDKSYDKTRHMLDLCHLIIILMKRNLRKRITI